MCEFINFKIEYLRRRDGIIKMLEGTRLCCLSRCLLLTNEKSFCESKALWLPEGLNRVRHGRVERGRPLTRRKHLYSHSHRQHGLCADVDFYSRWDPIEVALKYGTRWKTTIFLNLKSSRNATCEEVPSWYIFLRYFLNLKKLCFHVEKMCKINGN